MKENTLLDRWTGSGGLVTEAIEKHAMWEKRSSRRWTGVFLTLTLLAVILLQAIVREMPAALFLVCAMAIALVFYYILDALYKPLRREEPDMEHPEKYYAARDRLATLLGKTPEEIEMMDYNRLRNGIVLPTLDGLFAKLRAQAASCFEEDARATYDELAELHGACPPFRFLDGTEGRYTLEPFESYNQLLVVA